jgi:outer membrane protein assembly factor BamA
VRHQVTEIPDSPGLVRVQYDVEERREQAYVGQVIIIGNNVTKDEVIRKQVHLYPGQVLQYPEIRLSEKRLADLKIFQVDAERDIRPAFQVRSGPGPFQTEWIFEADPEQDIRPTITVLDNPGPFKDILVKVRETRTGSLKIGAVFVRGQIMLVADIAERNFDPWRWPTSWAEGREGRAFRGAGKKIHLQLLPFPMLRNGSEDSLNNTWRIGAQ